jgi:tRNA threonylcarbamoyladenosine biosynthesis protein TsaE
MEIIYKLSAISQASEQLLAQLNDTKTIAFHGEMGAGKTTFITAFCKALGVESSISSPTYSIINQYKTIAGQIIYHMDLYRLRDEEEAINAGVEDTLYSGELCLVEWPEKAASLLPENTLNIYIEAVNDDERKISW